MTSLGGGKTWFTAAELADLGLAGLPRVKRKVNELAQDRRWALQLDAKGEALARPRSGRGAQLRGGPAEALHRGFETELADA